jgi:hypothetical protein
MCGERMSMKKGSALCVFAAVLLCCLVFLPKPALAQTGIKVVEEDVVLTRDSYPPVKPSDGPVRIYAGEWELTLTVRNYDVIDGYSDYYYTPYASGVTCRIFLDNILLGVLGVCPGYPYDARTDFSDEAIITGEWGRGAYKTLSLSELGAHEIRIEVWHGTETTPHDTYSLNVLVVKPEVSGLQASSRVVRALGDNSLAVSFTNGGNENMRQAVLSVADSGGLTIAPSSVELGDVNPGEQVSASFTVSSPASVTLGTAQVRFSLSFIDYAGVSHTEDVSGAVEVYRLSPTLTVSAPSSVENGSTAEIAATLKDPGGSPIANENITLTVGGVSIGTFRTDSGGGARASYRATETGTLNVGASFAGSTSYDATSTSGEFTVTPAATFPYWVIVIGVIMALAAVLVIWRRRRREVQTKKET